MADVPAMPETSRLPPLPRELDTWFSFARSVPDDVELRHDGRPLDGLGVVDESSARAAQAGYRFVLENGEWADAAARGAWRPEWIVLDSIGADPFIADISAPGIPVLEDRHGEGRWNPSPAAPTLADFIGSLERRRLGDTGADIALDWEVWALDFGPEPLRALLAMSRAPLFPDWTRTDLLRLRASVPVLLQSGLTEHLAAGCVAFGTRHGARLEAWRHSPE
ncbi:hypothetical protein AB0P19_10470 [Microbacterium oleivorans]|uniref:hypothetical protein n=1 Tax=Microbacterium oleivorans TaxID=273677 RepID=UPI0033C7A750